MTDLKKNKKINIFSFLKLWLPVFVWALVIFFLSSTPTIKVSEFFIWDFISKKISHIFIYAVLFTLILRATGFNWILSFILTMSYAASDEYHQSFVLGRTASILDLGFDLTGANIAAYTIWKLKQARLAKLKK